MSESGPHSVPHAGPRRRHIDRRQFPRFVLEPMYAPVAARIEPGEAGDEDSPFELEGHAYDVSEGGMRFDLDQRVPPGSRVAVRIFLPGGCERDEGRSVLVYANVVWVDEAEDDSPGPFRTAAVFTHFARACDRDRLIRHFVSGRYRLAA